MNGGPRERLVVLALAPAKVNLSLAVLGRRADGYHELSTEMLALELADRLSVRRTERAAVELALGGPQRTADVPAGAENLVVRAATLVLELARERGFASEETGIAIELEKQVPSQAGLGGASSDAAAAVIASAAALGCELAAEERDALLADLGSDCVFFARAAETGFATCEGRGERVTPRRFDWPRCELVVVTPDVVSPTREVYAEYARNRTAELERTRTAVFPIVGATVEEARARFSNDLEPAALASVPGLASWRELLDRAQASHFRLAGSGSSFFGVFGSGAEADLSFARIWREIAATGRTARGVWRTRPSGRGASLLVDS